MTVSVAEADVLPTVAVMSAAVVLDTGVVVMTNVADDAPTPIDTLDGTVALPLLEASLTIVPPGGATPFKFTTPLAETPPRTD